VVLKPIWAAPAFREVYGVKTDRMAPFHDRARDAHRQIAEMSRQQRKERQQSARAFIAEHGLRAFSEAATISAKSIEMPTPAGSPKPASKAVTPKPGSDKHAKNPTRNKFYKSWEWRTLRMEVLKKHGPVCMCCGASKGDVSMAGEPVRICVDHIKPISSHWHLRLEASNLQILCDECNQGKGGWDQTDWRVQEAIEAQLRYTT